MANVTYTKLRSGNWGIRSTSALTVGGSVRVTKKSGETKDETVGPLVWSGNGVWLYAIASERPSRPATRSYGRRPYASGAGQAANVPGYSSWCTGRPGCGCYDCQ